MTADLLKVAIQTLRTKYPQLSLLVVDNGSEDGSINYLLDLQKNDFKNTKVIFNKTNFHHGPAMDQAIRYVSSPYILFLDSDTETFQQGWIELMIELIEKDINNYVVGKKVYMDKRGFDMLNSEMGIPYIRPICMLVRRELYLKLPPFIRHGTPCLSNMRTAAQKNYGIIDFPVDKYINHHGRGTASRFGYQLGWRGKLNYILHKMGF
jgi:glycosyltransferase involved in cell wall biosynthesis